MQDNNRHLEILQALAAGTNPVTGEVFPADSPYNQPEIIRALVFAINQLEALAQKGNQGLAWSEEEDALLAERFNEGTKITELAKLHSRTYGAIKARLIKLELMQKLETQQKCWASNLLYSQAQFIHYIAQHTKTYTSWGTYGAIKARLIKLELLQK